MTTSDVGRTITVPNDEVITITRHTTILTNRPPPTTSSTSEVESVPLTVGGAPAPTIPSPTPTTDSAPEPTTNETFPTGDSSGNTDADLLSPGVIVGMSVGGAILLAIIVMLAIFIKRRLKSRRDRQSAAAEDDRGRDDLVEEKHFPHAISAHTTETQGSTDPFAPFGGRVDTEEPKHPNRPPSNVFEMDATSVAPIELPTTSHDAVVVGAFARSGEPTPSPWTQPAAADPRSNLNSFGIEEGTPKYVNHWNQYKAMGST